MKLAVISGKGGSGKSSVAAALISLCPRVIAVDCDVDASNLPLLFPHQALSCENYASGQDVVVDEKACVGCGICVDKCAFGALFLNREGVAELKDFMCEGCGLCVRLCPRHALHIESQENSRIYVSTFEKGILVHGDLYPGDDNSGKMIARLRAIADERMKSEQIDLQILDGPPGIGCPVLSTVTGMDRILLVAEPTLSGISDLHRAYRVASSFCQDLSVIINKCDINNENRRDILTFCTEHKIMVLAELPFDRKMVEAQLHCETIVTYAPESESAQAIRHAYHQLILD